MSLLDIKELNNIDNIQESNIQGLDIQESNIQESNIQELDIQELDVDFPNIQQLDINEKNRRQKGLNILNNKVPNRIISIVLKQFIRNEFIDENLPLLIFHIGPSTVHHLVDVINRFYLPDERIYACDICEQKDVDNEVWYNKYHIYANANSDMKVNLAKYDCSEEDNHHQILTDGTTVKEFVMLFGEDIECYNNNDDNPRPRKKIKT